MTATLTAGPAPVDPFGPACLTPCPTSHLTGATCDGTDLHEERDGIVWHAHVVGEPGAARFLTVWTDDGDAKVLTGAECARWSPPSRDELEAHRARQAAFERGDHWRRAAYSSDADRGVTRRGDRILDGWGDVIAYLEPGDLR